MAMRRGVTVVARANSRRIQALGVRHYTYSENDPPSYAKHPPPPRPEGVPDTWTAHDIETDLGFFEDDCFPPALPGETLEEYCRRVPNVWSPCSRATDVVDCPVWTSLEFAQDVTCEDHQFTERPLVKIPPLDSDWHAVHEIEMDMANPAEPYTLNGVNPPLYSEGTISMVQEEHAAIMKAIRDGAEQLGHGHWFQSDNFSDFWLELTGTPLAETNMDGHLAMWLQQNPGKTLNEITKAIDPLHVDNPDPYWNTTLSELQEQNPDMLPSKELTLEEKQKNLALKMPIR